MPWLVLLGHAVAQSTPYFNNYDTSLYLMFQNNLNFTDDGNHISAILLDPMTYDQASAACNGLNETLMPLATLQAHSSDLAYSLRYQEYLASQINQIFWVQNGVVGVDEQNPGHLRYPSTTPASNSRLPVICTQSYINNYPNTAQATPPLGIQLQSTGNTYVGFRNLKSFLFLGIPFANYPKRFEYSTVYNNTEQTIYATGMGSACEQPFFPASSEACLSLNIQTPYIPKAGSMGGLRPVLVTIPGGGYTVGANFGIDPSNLVSHEDVVSVSINYRLGTFGFLAVPGTDLKGNYGIADQITALRWIKANIANFGGDPNRVTITGASAGASSVQALLGSPPVIQEGLISGALAQSNPGGGIGLGLRSSYYTTFSAWPTIQQSYDVAGQIIFQNAGCTQPALADQIACLKSVSAQTIINAGYYARFVVQDGTYIPYAETLVGKSATQQTTAHVPVIFGNTLHDGASFATFPPNSTTNLSQGLQYSLGIGSAAADSILASGLFPPYSSGNLTLDAFNVSARVASDFGFRCTSTAFVYAGATNAVFPKAWYYTITRTWIGYDANNLGPDLTRGPTVYPTYPIGDPNEFYFRLHGGESGFMYGEQISLRDAADLRASELVVGYVGSFVRTGDPNPDIDWLRVRGYYDVSLSLLFFTSFLLSLLLQKHVHQENCASNAHADMDVSYDNSKSRQSPPVVPGNPFRTLPDPRRSWITRRATRRSRRWRSARG
jgi:carboxylesterase type B